MSKLNPLLTRSLNFVGGVAVLVGVILIYNVWLWISQGVPWIPPLEGGWWGGNYETSLLGRQWCVARFIKSPSGQLQMALVSSFGEPDIFDVEINSSNETFVYLTFSEPKTDIRIEAKQLYEGERYPVGRLMAGRFSDFWKMNEDISIRGYFLPKSSQREFGIEPIAEDELAKFWKTYVRPDNPTPSPTEILRAAGLLI